MTQESERRWLCPYCLGAFVMRRGRLARHGFRAYNVRHGASTGFHTGKCQGSGLMWPIGTPDGNQIALAYADLLVERAQEIKNRPCPSVQEALEQAVAEARRVVLGLKDPGRAARVTQDQLDRYKKPEDFLGTSCTGWFTDKALDSRRRRMLEDLNNRIAELCRHAYSLRETVEKNPAP